VTAPHWVPSQVRCLDCPATRLFDPEVMVDGRCPECAEDERLFWLCPTCEGDRMARSLWGYPIEGDPCTTCSGRGHL
jgi:hypothetical protein